MSGGYSVVGMSLAFSSGVDATGLEAPAQLARGGYGRRELGRWAVENVFCEADALEELMAGIGAREVVGYGSAGRTWWLPGGLYLTRGNMSGLRVCSVSECIRIRDYEGVVQPGEKLIRCAEKLRAACFERGYIVREERQKYIDLVVEACRLDIGKDFLSAEDIDEIIYEGRLFLVKLRYSVWQERKMEVAALAGLRCVPGIYYGDDRVSLQDGWKWRSFAWRVGKGCYGPVSNSREWSMLRGWGCTHLYEIADASDEQICVAYFLDGSWLVQDKHRAGTWRTGGYGEPLGLDLEGARSLDLSMYFTDRPYGRDDVEGIAPVQPGDLATVVAGVAIR